MLRRVDLVRTDVSEELSAYFIRVTRLGELGTTLAGKSGKDLGGSCLHLSDALSGHFLRRRGV
jgi:hypothetical protein